MDAGLASKLIWNGEKLCFVKQLDGSLFLAKFRFDQDFSERCQIIPSWKSYYKPDPTGRKEKGIFQGYKIHYLDLKLLELLSLEKGYQLEFEDTEVNKKIRGEYLERRDWKSKHVLDIPMKRPLDLLQTLGAQFLFRSGWGLNADGPGAGKTAQAIGAVVLNMLEKRGFKTLVVCPKSVKGAWAKEIGLTTDLKSALLASDMQTRFEQFDKGFAGKDFVISSFDSFISDFKEIAQIVKPDIIIVDEVHRICNKENKITQILVGGKDVKKTFFEYANPHSGYMLTGTPISNVLEDLYPLLKILDQDILHWVGFRNRYCLLEEGSRWAHPSAEQIAAAIANGTDKPKAAKRKFMTVIGYQNEKELQSKLSLHMVRRTKDEILPDLPPKTFQIVDVELDAEERRIYDELEEDFTSKVRGRDMTVKSKLEWMTRAQQICDSLELVKNAGAKKSSKLARTLQIIKENAGKKKIVLFSKYKEMTDIIVRELKALKIPTVYMNGDTPDDDRQPLIDQFQEDEVIRVFVSTTQAGGVGITLTAAHICILYDEMWAPAKNTQAADRIHRRGLKHPVDIVIMRVKNSVEEYVAKTWIAKQDLVNGMINDEDVLKALTKEETQNLILGGKK
jgi:non-specific serine/threonine protein kinase